MTEPVTFLGGRVSLFSGDCLDVLKGMPESSVDSIVTDPPYGLEFMGKGWDGADGFRRSLNAADAGRESVFGQTSKRGPEYRTAGAGVTSKPGIGARETEWVSNHGWNEFRCETCGLLIGHGGPPCRCEQPRPVRADNRWPLFQAFMQAVAVECLRVLKPGGHLVAFGGTRTYHRLACAIEDAGFEIRDQLAWAYGSGFPKSLNVSKAIDKAAGAEREVIGRRIDGPSSWMLDQKVEHRAAGGTGMGYADGSGKEYDVTAPATEAAREWEGWGTAIKPAWEPICLARKPLIGTVAANVLRWGTGALNIDGCRVGWPDGVVPKIGTPGWGGPNKVLSVAPTTGGNLVERTGPNGLGRWPANLVHDGSDEVLAAFPHTASGTGGVKKATAAGHQNNAYGKESRPAGTPNVEYGDEGSAARFFYIAKADADDRIGSKHPTVKPVDLMRWLVRLVTPPGGTVLDCFAGTGTTGEAAFYEGFKAILIERDAEYIVDIERRMKLCLAGPEERKREIAKAKGSADMAGTLFAETRTDEAAP